MSETDELLVIYFNAKQMVTVQGRIALDQGYLDETWTTREDGVLCGPVIEQGTVGDKYLLTTERGRRFFRSTDDLEYDNSLGHNNSLQRITATVNLLDSIWARYSEKGSNWAL
jgi:hypothetical protein